MPVPRSIVRRCLIGMLLLITGCAPDRDLKPLPDYGRLTYRLGSGEQIRIITFGVDEMTGEFRIDDRGTLSIPLLGRVAASGKTASELETELTDDLRQRNILKEPSVSVEVLAYRPIFVLGEVSHPGQYPFQPGMTMLTAVAVAGGFTYRAVESYASDIRTTTHDGAIEGLITPKSFVAPGDVINVYERHF